MNWTELFTQYHIRRDGTWPEYERAKSLVREHAADWQTYADGLRAAADWVGV